MSQPAQPVRSAKHAIIRAHDKVPSAQGWRENLTTFTTRLVLTGHVPCELVSVKICVTFRIFVRLPSGSLFFSTTDLALVRQEVPYLRLGTMVRHVIDESSPLHGHTRESLLEGNASFALTVVGTERSSMAPIFHMQEYFVHDNEVLWDAEFDDIVSFDARTGQRLFNHAKLDCVKAFKGAILACTAISKLRAGAAKTRERAVKEANVA
eukprot:jgi/Mesen1/6648/ME000340S05811